MQKLFLLCYDKRANIKGKVEYKNMNYKFTKDDTWAMKGISILFLVCIHCLSQERIQSLDISFWPLHANIARWCIRLTGQCVGMFVFLSAYGMTLSTKKQYPDFEFTKQQATESVVKRYLRLVFKFLIPFWVCFVVTHALGIQRYTRGLTRNFISMIADILCIGNLFGIQMMVPTWWYLSLEVMLIVFLPLILRFYKKYGWLSVVMAAIAGTVFCQTLQENFLTKLLFAVPLAVWFADQGILEKLKAITLVQNKILNKIIKTCIAFGVICILCIFRDKFKMSNTNFTFVLLGLMATALIYFFYEFIIDLPGLRQILTFFGKHSANIFYIHSFVRGAWLKKVTYSFHSAWMIVAFVFFVTLAISIAIEFVASRSGYNRLTEKIVKKVTAIIR